MSITLTNAELAEIRSAISELLPDSGYIITVSNAPDGQGGQTETFGTSNAIACRIDPRVITDLKSGELIAGGAAQPFHTFMLTLPYSATITTDHRFLLDGTQYSVKSVDKDKSWTASVRCFVERI